MISGQAFGKIAFEGKVRSAILNADRIVRIYVPPSYDSDPKKRYPVLYLHDGQNTFSTAGPHAAFGWGSWMLDKTVDDLVSAKKMREIIMVAVDCTKDRYREYRGVRTNSTVVNLADPYQRYSRFLIEELKPKIDREYRTLTEATNTAVLGSSMGGICSLSLAWEHPDVFGMAASMSGAFQVEKEAFTQNVLSAYRGRTKKIRIYVDSGVVDYSGGDDGLKETKAVADQLQRIGWKPGKRFQHYIDSEPLTRDELQRYGLNEQKTREAQTSQHNEFYWRIRAPRPLMFLFPPEKERTTRSRKPKAN